MKRRTLLTGCAVAAGLSGCLAVQPPGTDGTRRDNGSKVLDATIETTEAGCGGPSTDSVGVDVTGDSVVISGELPAPHPCHEATLIRTTLEGSQLRVTIDVESILEPGQACILCHGRIEYLLTVELEDTSGIEEVVVDHMSGEVHRY